MLGTGVVSSLANFYQKPKIGRTLNVVDPAEPLVPLN